MAAFLLKPDSFTTLTVTDVEKLTKQDIKNSTGKNVSYVAARDVPIGPRKVSLFLLTDDVKAWQTVLKDKKVGSVVSGECRVVGGAPIHIAVKNATGGSKADVLTLAKSALKNVEAVDFAEYLVKDSHGQAERATGNTGAFKIDGDVFTQMMKVRSELSEYNKFASAFQDLATKYKMQDYKKVPVDIWASMLKGLIKSGYVSDKIPRAADKTSFVLAYQGADGKVVRETLLAEAMKGLKKFTDHASLYLDKVVLEVRKGGGTPTWSFWSGTGAKEAAKDENAGGVVLEGSIGSWFDQVWDFKPLTGVENLALWTSLSELYAQKAAEYYDVFSFRGYVGPGATREQSVFNKIEQPTFLQVLDVRQPVGTPKVDWYVVDCDPELETQKWKVSGRPSIKASSRDAALAEVTNRYGS